MSWIPAFEIGVWNAWIFTLAFWLPLFLYMFIRRGDKGKGKGTKMGAGVTPADKTRRIMERGGFRIWILGMVYSIFLPFKTGTLWFYIGLPIALIGYIPYVIASFQFLNVPLNQFVSGGLYRYSRHPQYVARVLMFFGVSIATASWVFLLVSIIFVGGLLVLRVPKEEEYCLEKYGDAYREYMNRTPKWVGIPKRT